MKSALVLTALVFLFGCSSKQPSNPGMPPLPPVVVPTPVPTPTPVVQGHWCVTGGGFSPCAPHSPLMDQACAVGQAVESDCVMNTCLDNSASCSVAKAFKSLGARPSNLQLK